MSFSTSESCHQNQGDYQECLEGAFNVSSGGIDQAGDYQLLIITLTASIIFIAAGWMIFSVYNSWNSGSFKFEELINRGVRVIIITSVLLALVLGW